MQQRKHGVQVADTNLSRRGCFLCCTEGHGRTEDFTAQAADDTGACHGHRDDRTVCIVRYHLFGSGKQCEHVALILRHDCDLRNISAHILHLAQTVDDV